ncbi:MAG: polyprenyl diphosphate synthase, partial [Dehalococcoidia bacterium]
MTRPRNLKHVPHHIAIIMDGNGRWAKKHHLPVVEGHRKGAQSAQDVIDIFIEYKIPYLTLYAFSTENWNRPREEVDGIFDLLESQLEESISYAMKKEIRFVHLGRLEGLSPALKEKIQEATGETSRNTGLTLCLAFNYGGRDEIVHAMQRIVKSGVPPDKIDEHAVQHNLFTAHIPDPDLIIRTGDEKRLSNFLLWQAAYAEIYFTPVLWPDFSR